jgi:hypothetical protein
LAVAAGRRFGSVDGRQGSAVVKQKAGGFIDLGDLRSGSSRYEVRLDLGAGIVLSIARG